MAVGACFHGNHKQATELQPAPSCSAALLLLRSLLLLLLGKLLFRLDDLCFLENKYLDDEQEGDVESVNYAII